MTIKLTIKDAEALAAAIREITAAPEGDNLAVRAIVQNISRILPGTVDQSVFRAKARGVIDLSGRNYVAEVVSVEETEASIEKATKRVVCKVDDTEYKARIERNERRALILAKLKKEQARVLSENQFAELAKVSPEAAALVAELKDLG